MQIKPCQFSSFREDEQLKEILELSRREYERSQMETQPKSALDDRLGFVNRAQQVTNENVIDLVSSSVTTKNPADILFYGTADEPIFINNSQDKDLERGSDSVELSKTDSDNVDVLDGVIALSCKSNLDAAKHETRNPSEFLESNEGQTSESRGLVGNWSIPGIKNDSPRRTFFKETNSEPVQGKVQKEPVAVSLVSSLTSSQSRSRNNFLQNRESAGAYSVGNLFKESETQKRRAPMIDTPERKRKRIDLNEFESDEDYARYLQEAFNREGRQSNLMKDDEELARKLAEKDHLDDGFSGEADRQSNLIEEDEKLARKLYEEDNYRRNVLDEDFKRETSGETNWMKGDEELARKIAEEDKLPRYSVLDEVLASALQDRLRNETKDRPVVDEDAVLAMQLNEQLNKESPKQIARIKPTVLSGRTRAFSPEWSEYSKREPSATYTPMSASKISFENQVSMKKKRYTIFP